MSVQKDVAQSQTSRGSVAGRVAVIAVLCVALGLALWVVAFSLAVSLLMAAGFGVVVAGTSTMSDFVETVVDAIARFILGVAAAVAALFSWLWD